MQTIKTNGLNLDALKADIANNEIRVLVNGQPETVDFKQWCRDKAKQINDRFYGNFTAKDISDSVYKLSELGFTGGWLSYSIYMQLDY